jgi:hypothetical protein
MELELSNPLVAKSEGTIRSSVIIDTECARSRGLCTSFVTRNILCWRFVNPAPCPQLSTSAHLIRVRSVSEMLRRHEKHMFSLFQVLYRLEERHRVRAQVSARRVSAPRLKLRKVIAFKYADVPIRAGLISVCNRKKRQVCLCVKRMYYVVMPHRPTLPPLWHQQAGWVCGLLDEAVSSSLCIPLNGTAINARWFVKDLEGRDNTVPVVSLKGRKESTESWGRIAGLRTDTWNRDLTIT